MPAVKQPGQKSIDEGLPARIARGARDYFVSLKIEWGKISFPTRKELIQSTIVVFLFTVILMLIISLYDAGMSLLFNRFLLPPVVAP
jgi:preprotein translocase subunit SecE